MAKRHVGIAPYPKDGSFAELLIWHLAWGTHPYCKTEEPNQRWSKAEFAKEIHGDGASADGAKKNLQNWTIHGVLPQPDQQDRIDNIFLKLFGNDANLDHWRADLERALERGRKEQAARIARRDPTLPYAVPQPTAHFMGRDDDVNALVRLLASPEGPRAVLVRGGPGFGKTELIKAIAHHEAVALRFGAGRYFVALDNSQSAAAMQDAIIRAVGGDPARGFAAALQSLHGRDTLLVLDNLETPWEPRDQQQATEQTLTDLAAIPGLAVLASFRGYQAVDGFLWHWHPVKAFPPEIATELFVSIAGPEAADDPHLNDFIRELGGIPLAIDLVARRAHGCDSLAPLWREWNRIGADFATRPGFEPARLTSLSHSIELSLNPLRSPDGTHPALRLLAFLGALPAGLAREDYEALMGDDAFAAAERLCHSGIAIEGDERINLLPPIREHARRRYPPTEPDADEWIRSYLGKAWGAAEKIGTTKGRATLQRLLPELSNIEAALRAGAAAGPPHYLIGPLQGYTYLSASTPRNAALLSDLAALFRHGPDLDNEAFCIQQLADIAQDQNNYDEALSKYREALAIYERMRAVADQANCLMGIGDIAILRADYSGARSIFTEALSLFQTGKQGIGVANCIMRLGRISFDLADYEAAQAAYDEALSIYQQIGHTFGEANCLSGLGNIAYRCSDFPRAHAAFQEALPLYRQCGMMVSEATCLAEIGDAAFRLGDAEAAQAAYEEALPIFQQAGDRQGEADCLLNWGNAAYLLSGREAAEAYWRRAGGICNDAGETLSPLAFENLEKASREH